MGRPEAVVLVGATGSGKSPLGDCLERQGLWGRECVHFDFGAQLRAAAGEGRSDVLSADELAFVRRVLDEGLLLEDEHFPIARALLGQFIGERVPGERSGSPLLILNGLPRHVGQARAMEGLVEVVAVVYLRCGAGVAEERIRSNTGGDRSGREDDGAAAIAAKQVLFERRTRPLVDYYRARGARVIEVQVDADTTPGDVRRVVSQAEV